MRIGILTFHSEINYGSVLQALAMQTHLESMGHRVVIVDKYEDEGNPRLLGPFASRSLKFWLGYLVRACLLSGGFARLRRHVKTIRMIRKNLKRTPYHFFKWTEAPKDLGVDLISVGSDQVWNPTIVDPPDYLLKNIPGSVPGIAYAASIGQHELAKEWLLEYQGGFKRFAAIGVREAEAKRLVESTGASATHVVDPTLLVDPELCWERFADHAKYRRPILFCYLMTKQVYDVLPSFIKFAEAMGADVELFLDNQMLPVPLRGFQGVVKWCRLHKLLSNKHVHVRFSAAPDEFVAAVSRATWVITESFHGLMFSTIFRKNVRIVLKQDDAVRGAMSSRLTEFADGIISGPLIKEALDDSLQSISKGEKVVYDEVTLAGRIAESRKWLEEGSDKPLSCVI